MRARRQAARIVVLDPDGFTFLFRYQDSEIGHYYWTMPGGGIETDETPRQAARRELVEETGWTDIEPGPLLWTWEHNYTRLGVPTCQHDSIYLATGKRREPVGDLRKAHIDDEILAWRWWSPGDLTVGKVPTWPPGLSALLRQLGVTGPPAEPVNLNVQ